MNKTFDEMYASLKSVRGNIYQILNTEFENGTITENRERLLIDMLSWLNYVKKNLDQYIQYCESAQ